MYHRIRGHNKKKVLSANGRKGGVKRHEQNQQIKSEILSLWNAHKADKENRGKIASKSAFAKKMADEYRIPYLTIRKNWLQGYEP